MKSYYNAGAFQYRWLQRKYIPTKEELLKATECKDINEIYEKYNKSGYFSSKNTIYRFIKHGLFEDSIREKFGDEVLIKLERIRRGVKC